jgi:hypothetical protein
LLETIIAFALQYAIYHLNNDLSIIFRGLAHFFVSLLFQDIKVFFDVLSNSLTRFGEENNCGGKYLLLDHHEVFKRLEKMLQGTYWSLVIFSQVVGINCQYKLKILDL